MLLWLPCATCWQRCNGLYAEVGLLLLQLLQAGLL
jgi:hypothetical protein